MEIEEEKAKQIAANFFAQYHSVIETRAIKDGNKWFVHVTVLGGENKVAAVDSDSGRILGWNNLDSQQPK